MYNPLNFQNWKEIWLIKDDEEIIGVSSSEKEANTEMRQKSWHQFDDTGYEPKFSVVNAKDDPDWVRLKKKAEKEKATIDIVELAREHIYKNFHSDEEQATFNKLFDIYDRED